MKVSVIIPTYKRPRTLLQTLESLQRQTLDDFEIIVMDNAEESLVEETVKQFNRTSRIPARYVPHSAGGNSGARNRGAKIALGDLLVFTDDDLTFDPNWLNAYVEKFLQYPHMVASGGCVRLHWEIQPPAWLLAYIGDAKVFCIYAAMSPSNEFTLSSSGFFFSCNMAIKRSVFETTGFRPEMFSGQTIGNGETGLNAELTKNGLLIGYVPAAIAYHHIPALRMTVKYICKWAWHLGGAVMFERWNGKARTVQGMAVEVLRIIKSYWLVMLQDIFVRHCKDRWAIDIQFQASLGWCKLRYVWWMITDPMVKAVLSMKEFRP